VAVRQVERLERLELSVAVERLERAAVVECWFAASFSLEVDFRLQKATAKLLNDAFYAILYCQIKKLSWSDPRMSPRCLACIFDLLTRWTISR
jgi:hypothetical protein